MINSIKRFILFIAYPFHWLKVTIFGEGHKLVGIVHKETVIGNALIALIAIMTFLAFVTIGSVNLIRTASFQWQEQLVSEATIILRPQSGFFNDPVKIHSELENRVEKAKKIARSFPKILDVVAISTEESKLLLKPWLGVVGDLSNLPIPSLLIVKINPYDPPNYKKLQEKLQSSISNVIVDDHRPWANQIIVMANTAVHFCFFLLLLVLTLCIIAIVFATKAALGANQHVVEVLHFIGAQSSFIAQQFNHYFFWAAFRGALIGGSLAIFVLLLLNWIFGFSFFENRIIYLHFSLTLLLVTAIAIFTCHYTILNQLKTNNYFAKEY